MTYKNYSEKQSVFHKLIRLYSHIALLLLNTVLLFLSLNGLIWMVEQVNPSFSLTSSSSIPKNLIDSIYDPALEPLTDFTVFRQIYPGMSDGQIMRLKLESWNVPFMCDSDMLYREKPLQDTYITIDPAGFRRVKDQEPWPPTDKAYNIFVFGGSTTFGYGETDEHTIPSYLQEYLRANLGEAVYVYNFGHASFFSLQERLAFAALLRDGFVPDMAIFINGLNELYYWDGQPAKHTCDAPLNLGTRIWNSLTCRDDEWCWPIQRLAARLASAAKPDQTQRNSNTPPVYDFATNQAVIERWLANKQQIEVSATAYGVKTLFVLQPVPGYAYDLTYHPFAKTEKSDVFMNNSRYKWGYAIWEDMALADTNATWTTNFLNLSHLGESSQEILYLDRVHYTRVFMDMIAKKIADSLVSNRSIILKEN